MKFRKLILATLTCPTALFGESLPSVTLEKETIEGLDISAAPVGQHLVTNPVTAPARVTIDPTRSRSIATFFSGQIDRDLVQPGEEVKVGQTLAHLKSREVAGVISKWIEANSKFETAVILYERERKLRPKKLTTEDDFLAVKANYQEALAARTAALQAALLARSEDDLLTLSEGDGVHDLTSLPIVSPVAGTIIKKSAYAGDAVELNNELFEIADLDQLLIEVQVPLKASSFLKVGDSLEFHTVVGKERIGTAKVSRIDPVVNQAALAVSIYAHLDNRNREWFAGTPVNVHVVDSAARKVRAVPRTSVVKIGGSPHLFLARSGGSFQPLEIKTGQSSQEFVEVTSELSEGARVVVSGASLLLAAWEDRAAE